MTCSATVDFRALAFISASGRWSQVFTASYVIVSF